MTGSNIRVDNSITQLLTPKQAWHFRAVPFRREAGILEVWVDASSSDVERLKSRLSLVLRERLCLHKVPPATLVQHLQQHYRSRQSTLDVQRQDSFVEDLINEAIDLEASDIHLEVLEKQARVRFRLDGALVERYKVPTSAYPAFVNQIKVRAGLDISQKRLPQDGRIQAAGGEAIDLRVSIIPTLFGEKVVMRLLKRTSVKLDLGVLGMTEPQLLAYRLALRQKTGLILVSGPTGSGKTTTLYASLNELNIESRNLITIEDPIEYTLAGINQVQIHESIGLTFPSAMRAFLRQDPNVLMVGEIRDPETAAIAIRLSLSGHLVLSTIHTNSAWGIVNRLVDMGVEPYLLADTLRIAVAQRLVRKLCTACRIRVDVREFEHPAIHLLSPKPKTLYRAAGCPACHQTGYRGRMAVYETLPIAAAEAQGIRERQPNCPNSDTATLSDRLHDLIHQGLTSLDEAAPWLIEHQ